MTALPNGAWGRRTVADMAEGLPPDARYKKAGRNRLVIEYADGFKAYRLHKTDVVRLAPDGSITLDDGGFPTKTTREAFNEGLRKFAFAGASYVWGGSQGGAAHVISGGPEPVYFNRTVTLNPDGTVRHDDVSRAEGKRIAETKAGIKRLCDKLIKAKRVPLPELGDCFFCQGGDHPESVDHLRSHLEESYLHGSLLVNALRATGVGDVGIRYWLQLANDTREHERKRARKEIASKLRRYLAKRLGVPA